VIRDRRGSAATAVLLALLLTCCSSVPPQQQLENRPSGGSGAEYAALMRVAGTMREAHDLNAAVSVYRQASLREPANPVPLVALGETLLELGSFNDAITAYDAALRVSPGNQEALTGLAAALIQTDRPQLAVPSLERELATHPANVKAALVLGVAYDLMGDHAAAQKTYRTGLTQAPGNPAILSDLALSLAIDGRYEDALKILQPVAEAPNATVRQRQNLALIYGLSGDLTAAERMARMDLDEDAVQHNLAYYETLRSLPTSARSQAIIAASARAGQTAVQ
jgi:Flp pilus assembly protein TadD